MENVEIRGLDDFEGGGAIPMNLGVDSASLPQAYLRPDWGVPPDGSSENQNPFYEYNSLSRANQMKLDVWLPWLKGDELFMKQDPDPLFYGEVPDSVKDLHKDWLAKNKTLRDGYAK